MFFAPDERAAVESSKISRREWDRGLPREGSQGRCCCKHSHSASERLLGYVVLMLHSLSNFASRCIPKHALILQRHLQDRTKFSLVVVGLLVASKQTHYHQRGCVHRWRTKIKQAK